MREILTVPNDFLTQPVHQIPSDDQIAPLAAELFETMYAAPGIGLAAPQVGLPYRMFVLNTNGTEYVFVDPVLLDVDRRTTIMDEGCLSMPGVKIAVERPKRIRIRAKGIRGEIVTMGLDGLMARCWQHEFDHLDGKLISDT